jgi:myo-inositol-1(or 4)-monophosphatase
MIHNDFYKIITEKVIQLTKEVALYIAQESLNFTLDKLVTKNRNDFVSYVDNEAERLLVKGLSDILPNSGFITEEGTAQENGEDYCWVIDPLDGTSNFIHNSTPYAISVAILYKEETVVGVIHEVTRNETFYAWKGSKSYLNGEEIQVSNVKNVKDALISTGRPHNYMEQFKKMLHSIEYFLLNTHGVRQSGSAATDLAYVACGRYDGRYEFGLKPWDVAAGILIIQQAGGMVSDFDGKNDFLKNGDVLVSNSLIFDEFKDIINSIFKKDK